MARGDFFGSAVFQTQTASFTFCEMDATVSDEEMPRHTHSEAYFMFILQGTYLAATGKTEQLGGPSTLIYVPRGTTHRDRFQSRSGHFLAISVAPEVADWAERALPAEAALDGPALGRILRETIVELRSADNTVGLVMEGLGLELVGRASRVSPHPDRKVPRWALIARDLIHDQCTTSTTIAAIADAAGVHPVTLARAFRQHFGCSPGQMLRQCRVERAVELLTTSRMALTDVAHQTGYSDQSQLTRAVRRSTGRAPGQLRRSLAGLKMTNSFDSNKT
ncbi:MAG TPA: AraC family transcriptional regulator [Blastocatellia bacterium]|nr:AraC family transcriptional regulator [Blastocatellia bacterium]